MISLSAFAIMYLLFFFGLVLSFFAFYFMMVIPLCLIAYMLVRKPFRSGWHRSAYIVNNICILLMLITDKILIEYRYRTYYLPFISMGIILFDWIFNIVVWIRDIYRAYKYGDEDDIN